VKDTQKQALLVHGWGGTHPLHWQVWLQKELEKQGVKVFFPRLPKPSFPVEKEWLDTIFKTVKRFDENTVCIGHSLGVPTILRVLEKLPAGQKIGAAVLVSGFCSNLGIPEIANFVDHEFDWKKIKESAKSFTVVYSDNDPFIPVEESLFLGEKLGVKPVLEKEGGHITAPDFGAYPRMRKIVMEKLKI